MSYLGTKPQTATTLADNIVTADKIVAGAVTDAKIAAMAASKLTGQVPDANAPSGSVIQVVEISTTAQTESSSTSFADTGLSGSITPSSASSRIAVFFTSPVLCGSNSEMALQLVRNGTSITGAYKFVNTAGNLWTSSSGIIYDNPNTTSPVTYKVQIRRVNGNNFVYFGTAESPAVPRMILMEIAA